MRRERQRGGESGFVGKLEGDEEGAYAIRLLRVGLL
jgi:hypothetical protein